ncbi:putative Heat shock factor binding 1 [Helianthus annuus]|nr:putative Heat shock factor binding 1 [Helianthus annuus]
MDGKDSGDGKQNTADMTQFVQTLLQQMQNRFQTMSDSIVSKNILFSYCLLKLYSQNIVKSEN